MIIESGRIVSVESDGIWVETIQKTACNSCRAEKGCGQRLINKWDGHTSYIWVLLEGRNPAQYRNGDEIKIGVPEDVIAKGAILVYLLPLLTLLLATLAAHISMENELLTTLSGFAGLAAGGLMVRWHSWRNRCNPRLQPVLIDDRQTLHFHSPKPYAHAEN